ncbi:MAG: hypothetical protein ACTSRK_13160 [Promethearchaeota archaeon]
MIFLDTFDSLQLALVFPKMLQFLVWVTLAILIIRKSKYILNKIFFAVFMGGALFALCDAVIYVVAPNSNEWLYWANIGRDISIIGFIVMSVGFYFAALLIKKSYKTITKTYMTILGLFSIILCILLMIFDRIAIFDLISNEEIVNLPPTISEFKVTAALTPTVIILYVIALSFLILSLIILFQVYRGFKHSLERKRIRFFIMGVFIDFFSFLYFLALTSLKLRLLYLYWFGYILAICSPVLILIGLNLKENV